jgi:uncharacterized membrane protein YeaQ/YmgE (transglycosylase-associated protein family)
MYQEQASRARQPAASPTFIAGAKWNGSCIGRDGGVCMFGILGWIVFGLIVGVIAKLLMPGKDPGGIIVTILLGIVGAVLGGYAGRALGMYGPQDSAGIFMSIIGAVVVLLIYRMAVGRRRTV